MKKMIGLPKKLLSKEELVVKVMRQLPGLPEPLILVQLPGTFDLGSYENCAKQAAQLNKQSVAIVAPDGQLLAYHALDTK